MAQLPTEPEYGGAEYGGYIGATEPYRWQEDWQLISCAIAAALLLWAIAADPEYEFYTFLRIYVSGLGLVLALRFWRKHQAIWLVAAVLTAILFNPVIPIEMEREDWVIFDLLAAAGFSWVAMSGPADALHKPGLRVAPLAVAGAIAAIIVYSQTRTSTYDNAMVVENLTAENLVMESDIAADESWYERPDARSPDPAPSALPSLGPPGQSNTSETLSGVPAPSEPASAVDEQSRDAAATQDQNGPVNQLNSILANQAAEPE